MKIDVTKCPHYEEFFGNCNLYITQADEFDDLGWTDAKCKDVEDCAFKKENK